MIISPPASLDGLALQTADPTDAAVRDAVLAVTASAFLIDPVSGQRIVGDTPPELPMVEALFARGAITALHVARLGNEVVSFVLYTTGSISGESGAQVEGLTIMGVLPAYQRRGIGTRLLAWSVTRMRATADALFVVGHPEFYARAGFVEAATLGLAFTFPAPSAVCRVAVFIERPLGPATLAYHPIVEEFF